jgi:endoglucanase
MKMNRLTTRGNRIVDIETDEPVLLRGVNRSGLEYSRSPIPEADFDHIVTEWGANVIRLPFNQDWALTSEAYRQSMDAAIAMAATRGAYTILDLQWLDATTVRGTDNHGQPNFVAPLPDVDSITLWQELAARYRDNPAVLYDIFNEPHDPLPDDDLAPVGRVTADVWTPWAIDLVDAIRSENPGALILVPGTNWAYDLSQYPIDGLEGVVYSTHVYSNKGDDWDSAFGNLSEVAPVFAGEWGGTDTEIDWGTRLADYFALRGIGWTAWSWCDMPKLTIDGAPTPFGNLVRSRLLSQNDSQIHDVRAGGTGLH